MNPLDFLFRHAKKVIYTLYFTLMLYGFSMIIWSVVDRLTVTDLPTGTFGVFLGVGMLSVLNAALGLYGTKIDDKCLVYASILFLFLTCITQILVTVIRITMPAKEASAEKKELQDLFDNEEDDYLKQFQQIELEWNCCGVSGYDDYEEKFDPLLIGYPASCCENNSSPCRSPWNIGCHDRIMASLRRQELIRAIIFIMFSILKFFSAIVIAILTIWYDEYFMTEIVLEEDQK